MQSNSGIYDMKGRLERALHLVKVSKKISDHNRELVIRFYTDCFSEGLSLPRVHFYLTRMLNIVRWMGERPMDDMTDTEIKQLVMRISQMNYAPRTIIDHNTAIKKFYKWLDKSDRRVNWIRTDLRRHEKKLPEELLNKKDVEALIKAAINPRDKALISVLWEGGLRIGELLGISLRNLEFDKRGAVAIVHGKTGSRRVRLVSSVPHLSNWIEHHPNKGDSGSALWVSIGSKKNGQALLYDAARMMIKKVARRAGLKKRVNPHIFRHSRATDLAKHLTEAQMKQYFGWTRDSDMPSIYVHLSGRDTDKAILGLYGRLTEEEEHEDEQMKPQICFFCKHENAPELDHCLECRRPLNLRTLMEEEAKEKSVVNMITPDMIEEMIEQKVREILAQGKEKWKVNEERIPASTHGEK